MYIRWINNPYKPELNGHSEHVSKTIAEVALYNKQAEPMPKPSYGTKEWQDERASAAPQQQVTPAIVNWSVNKSTMSGRVNIVAQCSRPCCSRLIYENSAEPFTVRTSLGQPNKTFNPATDLKFTHSCGSDATSVVPPEVLKRYAAVKSGAELTYTK